jgi:hypothetical protein
MKSYGNINFQQNLAQQLAFEVESGFPSTPVVGRILFTNKRLYICIDLGSGTPVWIPLTNEVNTYTFQQGSASATWNINHNLATTNPMVQIYDSTPRMLIPDQVTIVDSNNITVTFGSPMIGTAVIMYGDIDGAPKSQYAYTFYQTNLNTTWTVNHNLGYNPIVRVFVGTEEVQPATVSFPTINQVVITFATAQIGVARLI